MPMAKPLVSDALWELIAPLLPPEPPKPEGGRPRVPDRAALTGILFVLRSGIPWEMLPQEMGCGCGMTCWRRLGEWQAAGVWERLHRLLLERLQEAGQIDWSRAVLDSSSVRASFGGAHTGPNPTDRARKGSKHHVISDGQGTPLAVRLTAANVNDVTQLQVLVEAIPPLRGTRGRPRCRPRSCRPTGATIRRSIGCGCASAASGPCWPSAVHPMAAGWAPPAG